MCLLKHYDQHWRGLQSPRPLSSQPAALGSPEFEAQKSLVYSDRPVIVMANNSDELALTGELEMWLNGMNLVVMRDVDGSWQAQRPILDSIVRMQLNIKSIDWLPSFNC